jgi:hypothetical protein
MFITTVQHLSMIKLSVIHLFYHIKSYKNRRYAVEIRPPVIGGQSRERERPACFDICIYKTGPPADTPGSAYFYKISPVFIKIGKCVTPKKFRISVLI